MARSWLVPLNKPCLVFYIKTLRRGCLHYTGNGVTCSDISCIKHKTVFLLCAGALLQPHFLTQSGWRCNYSCKFHGDQLRNKLNPPGPELELNIKDKWAVSIWDLQTPGDTWWLKCFTIHYMSELDNYSQTNQSLISAKMFFFKRNHFFDWGCAGEKCENNDPNDLWLVAIIWDTGVL